MRPTNPEAANQTLVDTLQTAMLAFFACASQGEGAVGRPQEQARTLSESVLCALPRHQRLGVRRGPLAAEADKLFPIDAVDWADIQDALDVALGRPQDPPEDERVLLDLETRIFYAETGVKALVESARLYRQKAEAIGRVPPAPAPHPQEDAVVKYRVEPDDDGDWHVLTFSNGVERKIFTRSPLVIVQPEAH